MRILTVATEAPPIRSGIAAAVDRLTAGLGDSGHDVDLLVADDVGRRQIGEVRLTGLIRHWRRVRDRLGEYDVVHLHGPAPTYSDAFLAIWRTVPRARRPPLVYTHHSEIDIRGVQPLCSAYNRLHWRLAGEATRIVVSTKSYVAIAGAARRDRVEVIPLGVDAWPRTTERDAGGPFNVAFVGQLRPYKGVDILIRAAAQLPDVAVEIAGSGHQEQALRALAIRLGARNVRFHGSVTNTRREALLRNADVVALPSRTRAEAFGIVLLEGMSAGAVPVASDLPGVRDIAGVTGLLVAPGDPGSLVRAIRHLRDNPDELSRRSRASTRLAAGHRWSDTVAAYERVLLGAAQLATAGEDAAAASGELHLTGRPQRYTGAPVAPAEAVRDAEVFEAAV